MLIMITMAMVCRSRS